MYEPGGGVFHGRLPGFDLVNGSSLLPLLARRTLRLCQLWALALAQTNGWIGFHPVCGLSGWHCFVEHCLMPRRMRVEYPGAICHVMDRGERREDIFQSDNDRRLFLETLGQAIEKPVE